MKKSAELGVSAQLIATSISFSLLTSPAFAFISQAKERAQAMSSIDSPLKTKIPQASGKHAPTYIKEVQAAQEVKQLGATAVQKVEAAPAAEPSDGLALRGIPALTAPGSGGTPGISDSDAQDNTAVELVRPPLKALISTQDNLNPFSFDADYVGTITLQDVLKAALDQNLEIANNYAGERIQKYTYLAAASKFLPDVKSGYSLYGIKGGIPSGLLGGSGTAGSGNSSTLKLPHHIQLLTAGFTYNAYQGGAVLFGTLEQRHRLRAARAVLKGNANDILLQTSKRYYDLLLNEALLDIRNRAVEISIEQLRINSVQEKAGAATGLDVLQSQAQLASDQQNLVDQQQTRRLSSIQLSHILNASFAQDLVSNETILKKRRIVPKQIAIADLLKLAIDNRPELKQYEELRMAAKRAIVVAAAPLQPTAALNGTVYGIGAAGTANSNIFTLNLSVNWTLGRLGTTDLANIQKSRWQARQTAIQAKQIFNDVFEQVRTAYDQSLAADKRIEHASVQIAAAEEELRLAKKRMQAGIGLNIDVLNAQRDLTQASINKARAIVDFNDAQVQLVHDIGLISIASLTNGLKI